MSDKICGSNVILRNVLISCNKGSQLKGPGWSCDREKPLGGKCLGQQHVTLGDRDEGAQLLGAQSFLPGRQQPLLPTLLIVQEKIY